MESLCLCEEFAEKACKGFTRLECQRGFPGIYDRPVGIEEDEFGIRQCNLVKFVLLLGINVSAIL